MVSRDVPTCRRVLGRGSLAVSYSTGLILSSSHMRATRKLRRLSTAAAKMGLGRCVVNTSGGGGFHGMNDGGVW
jgi:hypothetical protein